MAESVVNDYDPMKVSVLINYVPVTGFADGTFVSITRNNQTWTTVSGASGEVVRSKTNDKTGIIEITLMQSSAFNATLKGYMLADEATNAGKFTIQIIDNNTGKEIIGATEGWCQQPPQIEYGKEQSERQWTIEVGKLLYVA